jgi:hypothetical protein
LIRWNHWDHFSTSPDCLSEELQGKLLGKLPPHSSRLRTRNREPLEAGMIAERRYIACPIERV